MGAAVAVPIVAGTLLSAYGQYQQGQAQAAQDRQNATYANMASADALQKGARDVGLLRMRTSQLIGQQKVGYAASGVDSSSGTPLQTMASSRLMGELDAATARNNAARQAWGYRVQANNYRNDANATENAATLGAMGTFLGGAGQLFGYFGGRK